MIKQSINPLQPKDTSHLETQLGDLEKPYVVMGVGIPGSGKTTILAEASKKLGVKRISPDDIREELTGSAKDQSVNNEAWAETHRRIQQELAAGHPVMIDATYAEARRRKEAVEQFRNWGAAAVVAVVFGVPIKVAKERNVARERVVPEYVLDRMHASLQGQPPTIDEGFDKIIDVSTK